MRSFIAGREVAGGEAPHGRLPGATCTLVRLLSPSQVVNRYCVRTCVRQRPRSSSSLYLDKPSLTGDQLTSCAPYSSVAAASARRGNASGAHAWGTPHSGGIGRGERNCAVMSDAGAVVQFVREAVTRKRAHTAGCVCQGRRRNMPLGPPDARCASRRGPGGPSRLVALSGL